MSDTISDMNGHVKPEFQSIADALERQVDETGVGGAAVSVYYEGEEVCDVWTGDAGPDSDRPWQRDTLAMSYSTTKGVASTSLHMCVDRGLLDYDDPVSKHWPEFGQNAKEAITVRQVLCHEAGLYPIRSLVDDAFVMNDWDAMVAALEAAEPVFEPGSANAYHGLTFGWLVGELVRRTSGKPISAFVADEIAAPLDLDGCYIGIPESELGRVATLIFPDSNPLMSGGAEVDAGTVASDSEGGKSMIEMAREMGFDIDLDRIVEALMPHSMTQWVQDPAALLASVPAANGCFTARSLARMYATLANGGELDGVRLLSEDTIKRAAEQQNARPDLVIVMPMMWRLGYHPAFTLKGQLLSSFGHSGFGGSGAWCDPGRNLAAAMTVNRISGSAVGDQRIAEINSLALEAAKAAA